jgi:hypothetical protein
MDVDLSITYWKLIHEHFNLEMAIHHQIVLNFWKSILTKIKIHGILNKVVNSCGGFIIIIDMGVDMGVKLYNGWKQNH